MRRLLARDEAAWMEFVERYDRLVQARILATCRETGHSTGATDLAAEISAEVYAALVQQEMKVLQSYSGRSRLSTWLAVIVRRLALRHLRRLPRTAQASPRELADPVDPAGEALEHQRRLQDVAVARTRLSATDQLLLRMFYDQARSYREIAAALEITVNAVGPKLDRARQRLRKLLEPPP